MLQGTGFGLTVALAGIVVAEASSNDVSFSMPQLPTDANPRQIVSVKMRSAGEPDLVVNHAISLGSATTVASLWHFKRDPNGRFVPPVVLMAGVNSTGLIAADINGDGFPDLVQSAGGAGRGLWVLLNDTEGGFTSSTHYRTIPQCEVIGAHDVDEDGIKDVIARMIHGGTGPIELVYYPSESTGLIGTSHVLMTPWAPEASLADVNGDGVNDLVWGGGSGDNHVVRMAEIKDGSVQPSQIIHTGNGSGNPIPVHLDSDGIAELVLDGWGVSPFQILRRGRSGVYESLLSIELDIKLDKAWAGDLNNDGKPEVAVMGLYPVQFQVMLISQEESGQWIFNPVVPAAYKPSDIGGIDASDGSPMLMVASDTADAVTLLTFDSALKLSNGPGMLSAPHVSSAASADFDGDGLADLAVCVNSQATRLYRGSDRQGFTRAPGSPLGTQTWVKSGDFNSDGHMDLAGGRDDVDVCAVAYALGKGDGTFSIPYPSWGMNGAIYGDNGDVNEDGQLDMVVARTEIGEISRQTLTLNDPTPEVLSTFIATAVEPSRLRVADVDQDGHLDIIYLYESLQPQPGKMGVAVRYGFGDGTFSDEERFQAPAKFVTDAAAGDVDGDNVGDLVMLLGGPLLGDGSYKSEWAVPYVLKGLGRRQFADGVSLHGMPWASRVAIADVNSDGLNEIVVSGSSLAIHSMTNVDDANVQFFASLGSNALLIADLTNDGLADVVQGGLGLTISCPADCSFSYRVGDLDEDGRVYSYDLSVILTNWGKTTEVGDLTGDCTVDGADLGLLLGSWMMLP